MLLIDMPFLIGKNVTNCLIIIIKKNETYRKNKIEKVKKSYYYKQEVKNFLNILLDEI